MILRHLLVLGLGSGVALGIGCSSADGSEPSPAQAAPAMPEPVDAGGPPQPEAGSSHVAVGSTYVLPEGAFQLVAAPEGNLNAVFVEGDRSLFVPHLAGAYRFRSSAGVEHTMRAVPASDLAFHNYNYFPTRAVAVDGATVWVASVLNPEIVQVDRATLAPLATIPTGSWPVAVQPVPSRDMVLVAARGEDTLTIVDTKTKRAVRSLFIGDEVSNVAVTPDGALAVALAPTDREAVFVDLAKLEILARVPVGTDPSYVAFSADARKVYVAGRKTGRHEASDAGKTPDPIGADLTEIDVASRKVLRTVEEVGTTLGGIALSESGKELFVVGLRNDPSASLSNPNAGHFRHTVMVYDLSAPAITQTLEKDITLLTSPAAAPSLAGRRAVSLHAPQLAKGSLWLLAEASDLVLELDPATLAEKRRREIAGRPRSLVAAGETLHAFGHQAQLLTEIAVTSGATRSKSVDRDPRDEALARGQRFFTGTGTYTPVGPPAAGAAIAGDRWSCASCHADGLGDKLVWQAGPVRTHRYASRPYVMLEGTFPLGWQGYLSDVRNYAFTVTTNVGVTAPTTEIVTGLASYLASIMPPPRANSLTARDGQLSAAAKRGEPVFQTECASCHAGPLTTSGGRVEKSLGDGKVADIPSLLGVYRQGTHFRDGSAKSIDAAVDAMLAFAQSSITQGERADLVRYVSELTGRDFFPIASYPRPSAPLPAQSAIEVAFSLPVLGDAANLKRVRLTTSDGAEISATVSATGRRVRVVPAAPLAAGTEYDVVIDSGLASEHDVVTTGRVALRYKTAQKPSLSLSGKYTMSYSLPGVFGPPGSPPPPDGTVELTLEPNADGSSTATVRYPNAPAIWTGIVPIDGSRAHFPPMPLTVNGNFADGFSGFVAELVDENADGIADTVGAGPAQGARGYTLSGPGFEVKGLAWGLRRK